jgi:hypothetical protein
MLRFRTQSGRKELQAHAPRHRSLLMLDIPDVGDDWRRKLRAQIGWVLAAKLATLTLLWFLFFRDSQS